MAGRAWVEFRVMRIAVASVATVLLSGVLLAGGASEAGATTWQGGRSAPEFGAARGWDGRERAISVASEDEDCVGPSYLDPGKGRSGAKGTPVASGRGYADRFGGRLGFFDGGRGGPSGGGSGGGGAGGGSPFGGSASPVPVPAGLVLIATAAAALGGAGLRRRRA